MLKERVIQVLKKTATFILKERQMNRIPLRVFRRSNVWLAASAGDPVDQDPKRSFLAAAVRRQPAD